MRDECAIYLFEVGEGNEEVGEGNLVLTLLLKILDQLEEEVGLVLDLGQDYRLLEFSIFYLGSSTPFSNSLLLFLSL